MLLWRGTQFVGVNSRRYKLWWCGNNDGIEGVGILVKEELCEKVVEVKKKVIERWQWCWLLSSSL